MKNFNQLSKRVVAFALALIMVLGYVPVGTVAAMETPAATAKTDTLVQVSLTAVGNEAPPMVTRPVEQMPPATIESYTYNAKVEALVDGVMTDVSQDAKIKTVNNDVSEDGCKDYTVGVDQEFKVEITYRGARFTLNSKDARDSEDGIVKDTLDVTYQTSHTLTQGQRFIENQFVPTVSTPDENGKWSFEPAKDFANQYVKNGAVIASVGEGLIFGAYTYRIGDNEPLAQINLVINVQAPTYDITISGADEGKWYVTTAKKPIVVTVTAKANVAIEGKNNMPGNLPVVIAEGANIYEWSKNEDNITFTCEIDITKTTTVIAGNQSLTVHVDGVKPTISNVSAYQSVEGTVVELRYTVGDSGVAKVELVANGKTYTFDKFSENPSSVLLKGVYVEKISKVTITSGAGLTSEPYPDDIVKKIDVTPPLAVSMTPPNAIAVIKGVKYINKGARATFEISNVSDDKNAPTYLDPQSIKISFTDRDGKKGQKSIEGLTFSNGKYTGSFAVNDGDKNISVSATDARNRIAKAEDLSTYACDAEAPVITLTHTGSGKEYENHELTYTVTIKDQVYLDLIEGSNASISVQYTINDETKTATNIIKDTDTVNTYYVEIPVVDGQKLGTITVNATDNCGNQKNEVFSPNVTVDMQRPVITVVPSENITAFYQNEEVIYAQLSETEDITTVSFTVTVKDANLPDQLPDGWKLTEDGAWETEFKKVVNKHQTGVKMSLEIPEIKDKAGWVISNYSDCVREPSILIQVANKSIQSDDNVLINSIYMTYTEGTEQEEGGFKLELLFDRRSPSSDEKFEIPDLTLTMPEGVDEDHPYLYNGNSNLEFKLKVTDLYEPSEEEKYSGTGVAKVEWNVNDGLKGEYLEKGRDVFENVANGEELILPVVIRDDQVNETNSAVITITVTDYLGNKTTFTSDTFSVDNKAPEITVVYDPEEAAGKIDNGIGCYPNGRTATVTINDLNYNEESVVVTTNGNKNEEKSSSNGFVYEFMDGLEYTFSIQATDSAGNVTEDKDVNYQGDDPRHFITDTEAPEITVEKTINKEKDQDGYIQTVDGVDYFDSTVTYTVTVKDANLDQYKLEYQLNGSDTSEVVKPKETSIQPGVDPDTVTYEFTLNNGDALTGMTITAVDFAGNAYVKKDENSNNLTVIDDPNNTSFEYDEGKWVYTGNIVIVDMTAPEITVEKTINKEKDQDGYIQTVHGVDYFDSTVTYTVTVKDANAVAKKEGVSADSGIVLTLDYNGDVEINKSLTHGELVAEDTVVYTFTLDNGNLLKDMTITAVDFADNAYVKKDGDSNNLTIIDHSNQGEDIHTSFAYNEKERKWDYTGRPVVVDTTAPTATMSFSDNVVGVYTNEGTIYVELKEPAKADSGWFAKKDEQTVEMSITVEDKNISVFDNEANEIGIKTIEGAGEWVWDSKTRDVDTDTTITYKQSIKVEADKTGTFSFQLDVHDLAGNAADFKFTPINKKTAKLNAKEGVITNTISVDRRRPSSVDDDNSAPVIEITPTITPATSINNLELFAGEFIFKLTVTDGELNELNSGLAIVSWVIEDETGFVNESSVKNTLEKPTEVKYFEIPVNVNDHGESNQVKLTITAVDNVGNTTMYTKEFAVDNLAPRISVTYDNNSVLNGKYFKADRTATISVTDINFNPKSTPINTQVGFSGWTQNGSTWTCAGSYTTDGQYTFKVESTDLAGNTTADAAVDYSNQAAPRDFVVDKTAPVINVTFDPASPVGRDDKNVSFYDQSVNVVVSIREVNFNAADVNAQFNSNNSFGGFSGGSDLHSAYETFDEGNEYRFSVAYTDLAGNAAVPYQSETFSVDLHEPTIKITEGSMTTEQLNMVQDELVLGFTINDEQENLKNYSVSVTHLNNEFKAVPVTGADIYTVSSADERTTVRVSFANIAQEKERDGIYTVEITAEDYAGHKVTLEPVPQLMFSLNRFGSTFMTDDAFTQSFLMPGQDSNVYQNTVDKKLIFKEINPNQVWQNSDHTAKGSQLTVVVNGTTTALAEGADYAVTESQEGVGNAKWYVYTYEVEPSAFMKDDHLVDGRYSLLIYSEDEAGNKNTNESNEFGSIQADATGAYSGKIEFTLDTSAPIISTTGIETGGSYNTTNQKLKVFLSDNTPVEILVNLNGQAVALAEAAGADNAAWLIWDDAEGCYVLNVPEQKVLFGHQNVKIQATDAAGNGAEAEISEFTVSSNLFVRIVNSIWLWIISAVLVIAILVLVVFLNKKRRNR